MRTREELAAATVPASAGADFSARRDGGLVQLTPLNRQAREWLVSKVEKDATWNAEALVLELRYFPPLADGILDAGFYFECDANIH